ncbi:50S ribosomal protein L34e [Candidatus Woesearchaeota archaeon]|nr:50S ribosomal protein L34e [Candidatus Woesearchaeota archaeon]
MEGKKKSRTMRRVYRRTPGGRLVLHFVKRKAKQPHCSNCGTVLHGMPRVKSSLRGFPRTKIRPERPYGGNFCSGCMRKHFTQQTRKNQ